MFTKEAESTDFEGKIKEFQLIKFEKRLACAKTKKACKIAGFSNT